MSNLARSLTPDEGELKKRQAELKKLEAKLAQKELELATLQAELHAFEIRYIHTVGNLYWQLDEIEAEIAEVKAQLHPEVVEVQRRAAEARARARETAEAVGKAPEAKGEEPEFRPSEELKQLYREVAKKIHPDLASDDEDRELRHKYMSDINRAYEDGDMDRLRAIILEWETNPQMVRGEDVTSKLDRMCRTIEQVNKRLIAIREAMLQLRQSELHQLRTKVEKAAKFGRDLLAEMARRVEEDIEAAHRRLYQVRKQLESNEQNG